MPTVPERYFAASDEGLRNVRATWWGAVVTDDRFPDVYDLNYARITAGAPDLTLTEVLAELSPPLEAAGSRHVQIVVLHADGADNLVEESQRAGLRLSSDSVMELRPDAAGHPAGSGELPVERIDPDGPEFEGLLRRSYAEFDVSQPKVVEQLLRWNREVLAPGGRRYFVVRRNEGIAGMGALHVAGGIAYVDDIVTFPEHRRQGVASAIVRHAIGEAKRAGAESTFLLADQAGPIRLYRSLGFEETGRLRSLLGPATWAGASPT